MRVHFFGWLHLAWNVPNWSGPSKFMRECAERLLGVISGKVVVERESWYWNGAKPKPIDQIQKSVLQHYILAVCSQF